MSHGSTPICGAKRIKIAVTYAGLSALFACSGSVDRSPPITGFADDAAVADHTGENETPDSDAPDGPPSTPSSCRSEAPGTDNQCGQASGDDCCASLLVPGGKFLRYYDGVGFDKTEFPATVSAFWLDKYPVTVGRFRKFVEAFPDSRPKAGDGAHPNVPESGWKSSFPIAADQLSLRQVLAEKPATCVAPTWTDTPGSGEDLPINCVTWYEMFAFCAWDGGRLPSVAEYQFAALGGAQQRVYPWSVPPDSQVVDASYAVYSPDPVKNPLPAPLPVGTRPKGAGLWGHLDLAGNVESLLLDQDLGDPGNCANCVILVPGVSPDSRLTQGGYFGGGYMLLQSASVFSQFADQRRDSAGGRCVRMK